MKSLLSFARNVYSQNGEDGILAELLHRLAISNGWFVEFGAWDGKNMSNTFLLAENGWSGVFIEGNATKFRQLQVNTKDLPGRICCVNAWVTAQGVGSLDCLLSETPLPQHFELLSIDIDSDDYAIWQSVERYQPVIVIIEINSSFPPEVRRVHRPNSIRTGSSFQSVLELGTSKGYTLVCHTGNMIFVKNEFIRRLNLPRDEIENPEQLFVDSWLKYGLREYLYDIRRWLKNRF